MTNEPPHFYKKIAELIPYVEGEWIERLYVYLKQFELDKDECYEHKDMLMPTLDNVHDMQLGIAKLFNDRHDECVKQGLYHKDWLNRKE